MTTGRQHYVSHDDDSARWDVFDFRDGDIVVSTRSKSGTTWVQHICALLVHGTPDLPAPLAELSPWVDHCVEPVEDLVARLAGQRHRRVVKTHTPLDGIPLDPRATYVVVGREPLDLAVSLYHQIGNIDRRRMAELTGEPEPPPRPQPPLHDWLVGWTLVERTPLEQPDSLVGVVHHAADAWRRVHDGGPAVVLVHYDDLLADLEGQMRRLADLLGTEVPRGAWPGLVEAATFESMRSRAATLFPGARGVLKDPARFFRRGSSGAGREELTDVEHAAYEDRLATLAPADVLGWLHR